MEEILKFVLEHWPSIAFGCIGVVVVFFLFKNHLKTVLSVNEDLRNDFERIRVEAKDVRGEFKEMKARSEQLEGTVKVLERKTEKYEKHISELRETIAILQKSYAESMKQVDNMADMLGNVSQSIHSLEAKDTRRFEMLRDELRIHGVKLENVHHVLDRIAQTASSPISA